MVDATRRRRDDGSCHDGGLSCSMEEEAQPNHKRFATCQTCGIIVHVGYHGLWQDDKGQLHGEGHQIEELPNVPPSETAEDDPLILDPTEPVKVTQRITDIGYYYRAGDMEVGPFTVEDEQDQGLDSRLAKELSVEVRDIMKARLAEIQRPTTFDEVGGVLGSTIRRDLAPKLILFSSGLLDFTDQDQINILMSGESAGGKSYTALEVLSYFPPELVRKIATASPTAFFHDHGVWDQERRVLVVNLKQRIILFLDQPHYSLLERLRPMLSHDTAALLYKITDKSKRGSLRTKNVELLGYPTIIFCAAKLSLDDQERTRVFILSPETSTEKLEESLRLAVARVGDRDAFKQWLESNPLRLWLKARVAAVQSARIQDVILPDQENIYKRFLDSHSRLAPRHQRDLPRILALIKAHALLNCWHREHPRPSVIVANQDDVEAGFWLYGLVAKPNELGLSPQVYEIYESVIKPLVEKDGMVERQAILAKYYERYGRFLAEEKLRREILPALEASGLVMQAPDPDDKRRMLVCTPHPCPISEPPLAETIGGTSGGHSPPPGPLDNLLKDKQACTPHPPPISGLSKETPAS
jgi:hypothetical protein